jgi:hypothetical protein
MRRLRLSLALPFLLSLLARTPATRVASSRGSTSSATRRPGSVNDHYWVFLSGLTAVAFTMTVGEYSFPPRTYTNPLGHSASTVTDISAFGCTP